MIPASGAGLPPLFLIGYRATGKSTVGLLVASELGVPFLDTDRMVEKEMGISIAECFLRQGEKAFRRRESEALKRILSSLPAAGGPVVATGGGIVLGDENVRSMRSAGRVIWLTAPAETIRARLGDDPRCGESRPSLSGRCSIVEVEEVRKAREPLYRSSAHFELSTEGLGPAEVVSRVVEWLRFSGGDADSKTC